MKAPFGFTVFCDDVRKEIDGKETYVGSYPGDLLIRSDLPILLPKFGFAMSLWLSKDDIPKEIAFRIFFPGDSDEQPSFEAGVVLGDTPPPEILNQTSPYVVLRQSVVLSPVEIREEGRIRVRAICNGDEVKLGTLKVRAIPPEQPNITPES